MKIYNGTGTTSTQNLKVQKSVNSIIIATDKAVDEIVNEVITVFIERANMPNKYLCNSLPLIDFIIATNYNNDAVQSLGTFNAVALCELSEDGAIRLQDGETLNIKIDGLNPAKVYDLHAVEDAVQVEQYYKFDRKSMASEDTVKTINVANADLAVIDLKATVNELTFKYSDGSTTKFTPFELRVVSRDIDPLFCITLEGLAIQGHPQKVAIPLFGVKEIEIVKTVGDLITVVTRMEKNINDED